MKKNIVALGAIISAAVPVLHWLFLEWWSTADNNEGNDQEAAVFLICSGCRRGLRRSDIILV